MRSSSEVKAVRVRNALGQQTIVSQWHAIVPGFGLEVPPGVACGTALSGSLQFETWEGVRAREGGKHKECFELARNWIDGLSSSPGPVPDQVDREPLAAPGEGGRK
jgi:hypothetical protein